MTYGVVTRGRLLTVLVLTCLVLGSSVSHAAARSDQRCDEDPGDGRFFTEAVGTSVSQSFSPARGTVSGFEIAVANINRTTWRGTIGAELVVQSPAVQGVSVTLTRLAVVSPRPVAVPPLRRTWVRFTLASPLSAPAVGAVAIRISVPAAAEGTGIPPWAWLRCHGSYSRGEASVQASAFLGPLGTAGTSAQVALPNDTQFRTY